jgi:hypothetical protein
MVETSEIVSVARDTTTAHHHGEAEEVALEALDEVLREIGDLLVSYS